MPPLKLLCFAGSTREGSFNRKLARAALLTAQKNGAEADLLELSDYPMPLYNGDLEKSEGPPENAAKLRGVIRQYSGIFIANPEYNASVTPLLKNTLDWMSRVKEGEEPPLKLFQTRVFAIGGAAPGANGAMRSLMALRQILMLGLGALVIPEQIAVGNAASAFREEDGLLQEERLQTMLNNVMGRLADSARRFEP